MDDTIENLLEVWIEKLNDVHGTSVSPSDVYTWNISQYFRNLTSEQLFAPLYTESLWEDVRPLPGACDYIQKLIKDGHEVMIVTASCPETLQLKTKWVLKRYFPFITERNVIIAHKKQMIDGDIMVDDNPMNLIGGKYVKLLKDSYHNRGYDAEANNMYRVHSWSEIYNIIKFYSFIKDAEDNNGGRIWM